MRRRDFLRLVGTASLAGCFRLARAPEPEGPLSAEAAALLDRAWQGIDPARVLDVHTHVVGLGAGGTGAFVNPELQEWFFHPVKYARFSIYRTAAGVSDLERADAQYVERLVGLVRAQPRHGRNLILAFDQAHGEDGSPQRELTEFYTPNDYVLRLARESPDCFLPAASIHPYRKDAVDELARVVEQGAVAVKWLPNAMYIDPGSPLCDPFYRRLAELGVPLLTHAGEERAVEAEHAQLFGNPLLLRRALDQGVKVIIAHCASLGQNPDLDSPGQPLVANQELFFRLMGEERWRGRLFGDISALGQYNRCQVLREVLARSALHPRLVNGSDYPLPAINALVRTGKLVDLGYITEEERELLNEIDRHNPLAFDFALKRTVRVDGRGFPEGVFTIKAELFRGG